MYKIRGLLWARESDEGPRFPKVKLTGSKAAGIAYEKRVGRQIRAEFGDSWEIKTSQWIEFEDSQGSGWACPDLYMIRDDLVVCVESKLTQTKAAERQLLKLYLPLLLRIYARKVVCVQSCRNLITAPEKEITKLQEIIDNPRIGMWTWYNRI